MRSLDGDQAAYRVFLSETGLLLREYLHRHLGRAGRGVNDIEDIAQEALLVIHSRRHTYDPTLPVTAWIYAIARYKLIDFLRSTNGTKHHLSLDQIEMFVGDDGGGFETTAVVRKMVSMLPERLRASVECTKLRGLSVAQTAARTGMSEAAVKVNVHRGLKVIARMLTETKH